MTWFLATMSGLDVAAGGCILAALSCLLLRHRLPMGLGAALFALAASVGATITTFHHQWLGSALLDRAEEAVATFGPRLGKERIA